MKREVNPRLSYKKSTLQIIVELSKTIGIEKKFVDMTRDDVLSYLDRCRKLENEDPLHKWIGSYNTKLVVLSRFFKWLHYPDIDDPKRRNELSSGSRESQIASWAFQDSKGKRSAATNLLIYGHRKTIYYF